MAADHFQPIFKRLFIFWGRAFLKNPRPFLTKFDQVFEWGTRLPHQIFILRVLRLLVK